MNLLNRCIARLLIVCTFFIGMPLPGSAAIITTDRAYDSSQRDRVKDFLDRSDVRAQMQSLGVDANVARARVDAMTDQEVASVAGRIDQMPAGGDSFLGILFAVFIILLITDILGLTKVFPFTRSVRH